MTPIRPSAAIVPPPYLKPVLKSSRSPLTHKTVYNALAYDEQKHFQTETIFVLKYFDTWIFCVILHFRQFCFLDIFVPSSCIFSARCKIIFCFLFEPLPTYIQNQSEFQCKIWLNCMRLKLLLKCVFSCNCSFKTLIANISDHFPSLFLTSFADEQIFEIFYFKNFTT